MKNIIALIMALTLIFILTACSGSTSSTTNSAAGNTKTTTSGGQNTGTTTTSTTVISTPTVIYTSEDTDTGWNTAETTEITLSGNSISLNGDGAAVEGSTVTINSAGTYLISGTLADGQIIVNTEDEENVKLILNGVDITCSSSSPIYVMSAKKTVIVLAAGTDNYIADGSSYSDIDTETNEPDAAIFCKSDLTITGNGSLTVEANFRHGILSKDEMMITGGNITINAAADGIRGRDYIAVSDGNITITAGSDGLQSNNDEDTAKGFIVIDGGTINITAGTDGIQGETSVVITDGNIAISTGGGSANSSSNMGDTGNSWGNWGATDDTAASAKAIKAGVAVTIDGGTINIDSSDDSIHTNNSIIINGGVINMASGDDGIHADSAIEINGGDISITKSYEGIESAVITINNDTDIHITSSDDGINVVGGVDASAMGGRPGQNNFAAVGNNYLNINGGYVYINAGGDGIDVNGSITMSAGVVLINGPTNSANGALDFVSCKVTGGLLVAAGSSGMAQAPGNTSTQYSVIVKFTSAQKADTIVHIATEDGQEILTFTPVKAYQSIVVSSSELKNGTTYVVYTGGSSTGTVTDGLYADGTYSADTQYTTFTISGITTSVGTTGGGKMQPGGGRQR